MSKNLFACAMMLIGTCAIAAPSPNPVLTLVVERLTPVVSGLKPSAGIELTTGSATLRIDYLAQTYKIHDYLPKTSEVSKEARDEIGPTSKGFVLCVSVEAKGSLNQLALPQTLQRPYWKDYAQVTPVAGTDKQVFWVLSYGSQTDRDLLAKIRQCIEGMKDEWDKASVGQLR